MKQGTFLKKYVEAFRNFEKIRNVTADFISNFIYHGIVLLKVIDFFLLLMKFSIKYTVKYLIIPGKSLKVSGI